MAARRLVIVMLVLLAVSTLAAALFPAPGGDETTTTRTQPAGSPAGREPRGELVRRQIDADRRKTPEVSIVLGDQLSLRVTSSRFDQVSIPSLGELQDVGPDDPAIFDLLPFKAGSYPVRLLEGNRVIGRIEVREPKRESGGEPRDPPLSKPDETVS